MIKINNKCRTCFNETTKGLQSLTKITTDEQNQQKSYAELLNEVANINVSIRNKKKKSRKSLTILTICTLNIDST